MYLKVTATLVLAIITVNHSENKFDALKNANKSSQNQGNGNQIDLIKMEIKKYMSECGAEVSDEDDSESMYKNRNNNSTSSNNNNNNNGGNNSNSRVYNNRGEGNQQNHGNNGYGNQNSNNPGGSSRYGQNYGDSFPSHDYNQNQNRDYPQTNYGTWGGSDQGAYSNPHRNMDHNRSGFGNYNGNYGYGQYGHDSYGVRNNADNRGVKKGHYGSYDFRHAGYNPDGGYIRQKRSEDDVECISQCVFGYLEVLDDNRSPSESAMIKWLQDHLPNDGKRIKAIRDARRCFARLAASDNDDGCDFSTSLSKCLNWEIEK